MKDIKELLKDLLEGMDMETFFDHFELGDYYSELEGAFKDEGNDYLCDLCDDFSIASHDDVAEDKALESIEEHIFTEHALEILEMELKKHFMPITSPQATLEVN